MNILALDSATEACSVALMTGEGMLQQFEVIGRGHAEHLLPMMHSLLAESEITLAQVDLFAYGAGPGSFTGIRIGAAMMQGLALANDRKLVAVSSLAALACGHQGLVCSVIDARMEQVYCGLYELKQDGLPLAITDNRVLAPADVQLPNAGLVTVAGTGWDRYREVFMAMQNDARTINGVDKQYPHAADIARLAELEAEQGRAADPELALPHYVRDKVAKKMSEP